MSDQVLKLTGIIQPGFTENVYVGHIKEISGIISQGSTQQEAFDNLKSIVSVMLEEKRDEALKLLNNQNLPEQDSSITPDKHKVHIEVTKEFRELHEA